MEQKGSSAADACLQLISKICAFLPPSSLGRGAPVHGKWPQKKRTSITNDSVMMYKWIVKLDFLRTIELGELLVKRSGRHAAAGIVLQRVSIARSGWSISTLRKFRTVSNRAFDSPE